MLACGSIGAAAAVVGSVKPEYLCALALFALLDYDFAVQNR